MSKFLSEYNVLSLITAFALSKAGSAFFNSIIDATLGVLITKLIQSRNLGDADEDSFAFKAGETLIYFFRLLFMVLIAYIVFSIANATQKQKE